MGLFKKVVIGGLLGGGAGAIGAAGASVLGGGGEGAAQFNPDIKQVKDDIQGVRDASKVDIKEQRKQALEQQKLLKQSKLGALDDLSQRQDGVFAKGQQQLAMSGGRSQGGAERLARQNAQQSGMFSQRIEGEALKQSTGIVSSDFASQQALKDRALFATPQLGMGVAQIENQAAAANMQAKAMADAKKGQMMGALGSLAGAGVGAMLGGPAGAGVGASVGGGVFGSMA